MSILKKFTNNIVKLIYNRFLIVIALFLMSRCFFIYLMPDWHFSLDMASWIKVATALQYQQNPYNVTSYLNWGPIWMIILFILLKIFIITEISFSVLIQIFLISTELSVFFVIYQIVKKHFTKYRENILLILLFGLSLNPIAIFQVCQHCNFDVLVAFWLLLFIYMIFQFIDSSDPADWLFACLFLGIAILTKTVPVVLIPILFINTRRVLNFKYWFVGSTLVFAPVFLSLTILFILGPKHILNKVLLYSSYPGYFGFTGLMEIYNIGVVGLEVYRLFFIIFILSMIIYLAKKLWDYGSIEKQMVLLIAAFLLAVIPSVGPGYTPQYIYWFLPLMLILYSVFDQPLKKVLLICYIIASCTYTVEYAFFESHGAFITKFIHSQNILDLSTKQIVNYRRNPNHD